MNDFLHQLRSGAHKRYDKSRRNYDGNTYRGNERGNARERKMPAKKRPQDIEQLQAIRGILQSMADVQKAAVERQAAAAERQAEALEAVASCLRRLAAGTAPEEAAQAVQEAADKERNAAPAAQEPPAFDRDALLDIIRERKEAGDDFSAIARHLNARAIPTITGKGCWRAQSVSRLYGQVG